MTSSRGTFIGVLLILVFATSDVTAQQTVYKWTDEDGVVHFGEAPPPGVEAERITTQAAPSVPPPQPAAVPREPASAVSEVAAEPDPAPSPAGEPTAATEMTLAELDARCEAAREAKIAPLREAEIENCKADRRNDPAFCENFNADFGEGGRTITGAMRPRMFDDLPECVEAMEERNRRPN